MRVVSTYRLQLHAGFRLSDARELVPYLSRLGISHVYLSPILRARSGSTHGYDVVDPTTLNPELGTDTDLAGLVEDLRARDMGIVLDIVPNHMATGPENPYWEDVLSHGRSSRFARWFDIDWAAPVDGGTGRILLPALGDRIGRVLERGELRLEFDAGIFRIRYFEQSFPVDPASVPAVLEPVLAEVRGETGSAGSAELDRLDEVLKLSRALPSHRRDEPEVRTRRLELSRKAARRLERLARESSRVRSVIEASLARLGSAEAADRFRRLLDRQPYRLASWRRGAQEINFRRFFTLSHLVAIRQEDPAVFMATHEQVLDWVAERRIDGLRIDHVDGLLDPLGYLLRLRDAVRSRLPDDVADEFPIFVEKILAPTEELRRSWPVAGTTGYEWLNRTEDLFIRPNGFDRIVQAYVSFTGSREGFETLALNSKRRVLDRALAADVRRLARRLRTIGEPTGAGDANEFRGERPDRLAAAIRETVAALSVYRTYVDPRPPYYHDDDRRRLMAALDRARAERRAPADALDRLDRALTSDPAELPEADRSLQLEFIQRFQQLGGPAAAKGIEDTAFYIYVPLASRNEVGGHPSSRLEGSTDRFHRAAGRRAEAWPMAMSTVTTHDTKRSADLRARLDVLSGSPDEWIECVRRWHRWNRGHRHRVRGRCAPNRNTEYLLYQTLVGIWPLGPGGPGSPGARSHPTPDEAFRERIQSYMKKAVREAKLWTSWTDPDPEYEGAIRDYIDAVLSPNHSSRFLSDLDRFAGKVARAGMWGSAARTVVQLTAPGIPDIYQGDELWNLALVDPDNRRPVDFEQRRQLLDELERPATERDEATGLDPSADLVSIPDDRLKLLLTLRILRLRRERPGLFLEGGYEPLVAAGAQDTVFAFGRRQGSSALVTVVCRTVAGPIRGESEARGLEAAWTSARIRLGSTLAGFDWTDVLADLRGDTVVSVGEDQLRLDGGFERFPLALLLGQRRSTGRPDAADR